MLRDDVSTTRADVLECDLLRLLLSASAYPSPTPTPVFLCAPTPTVKALIRRLNVGLDDVAGGDGDASQAALVAGSQVDDVVPFVEAGGASVRPLLHHAQFAHVIGAEGAPG